jgi:O-antigen/teichoic acid export membrane protein
MIDQKDSYRQIMKSTSLFGGVQVFKILIAIVRSKFIAVLLGPTGMGIAGLLTATTGLIGSLTNFGLGASAVKDVAAAAGSENQTRIAIIITVLRRWVWVTGLLGMVVTIATAPLLSQLTFGNNEYTFPFIWISISLLLAQLSSGQMVLLQGLRKIKFLAKANLTGSILGLIITIPLYYWLGVKGIVPAIIIASVITLLGSWYFARKIKIEKVEVSKATTIAEGKGMLTMGFMISLSGLITLGASYIVRIFISHQGGVDQVGLYNAGFALINSYVGLIFLAMGTDYYPRLSAVAHNNDECRNVINQQAEIAILIIAPIIILFIVFINWIVVLLYSTKFAPINEMILWAAMGMFFKAVSWAIAFIFMAKGASRLFFWNELLANVYVLALNCIGYYYLGLLGLGISFLISYLIYLIQVFIIATHKYDFIFQREMYVILFVQLALAILAFTVVLLIGGVFSYVSGSVLLIISVLYSYKELDKRLDIKMIFRNIFNRKKGK